MNAAHYAAGGTRFDAPVIITKRIRKGTKPTPFFSNESPDGMLGFSKDVSRIGFSAVREHIAKSVVSETDSAVGRIP